MNKCRNVVALAVVSLLFAAKVSSQDSLASGVDDEQFVEEEATPPDGFAAADAAARAEAAATDAERSAADAQATAEALAFTDVPLARDHAPLFRTLQDIDVVRCPASDAYPHGDQDGEAVQSPRATVPARSMFWKEREYADTIRIRFRRWGDPEEGADVDYRVLLNGPNNSYTWCVAKQDISAATEEVERWGYGAFGSAITIPFKLRPKSGESPFNFGADASLSAGFGVYVESPSDVRMMLLMAAGISAVDVPVEGQSDDSRPAFSLAVGFGVQFGDTVGVGLMVGWDWIGEGGSEWDYQGRTWVGLALGATFASAGDETSGPRN